MMYKMKTDKETRLSTLKDNLIGFLMIVGLCLTTTMDYFDIEGITNNFLDNVWFILSIFSFLNCVLLLLAITGFYICYWRKHPLAERIGRGTIIGVWIQFFVYSTLTIGTLVMKANSLSIFIHLMNIVVCLGFFIILILHERQLRQLNVVEESV